MKRGLFAFTSAIVITSVIAGFCFAEGKKLKIGITLHPYYSWIANIVGDTADIVPIIRASSDPHYYQYRPTDLTRVAELDVVVVNGLGHDAFLEFMLKSAGREKIIRIDPNKGLPLIPIYRKTYAFEKENASGGKTISYNSHTYIAVTGAIQQIYTIARELGRLQPDKADFYRKNARAYARRLRLMLASALRKTSTANLSKAHIAVVHDGYAYLMQELGIEISAVVQPRHGIEPDARQLKDTINRIKEAGVNVLFTELDYEKRYVDIIYKETGCRIYSLSHISHGPYTAEKFEKYMQKNLDTIVKAFANID